jgi:hypothetical protein
MRRKAVASGLLFMLISLLHTQSVFAGAWTVPKHHVWGEYYMKWDYAKDSFDSRGKRATSAPLEYKDARTWEFIQEQKLEYGVTDWLTGMFALEWKEAHYKEYDRPADWDAYARKNHGLTNIKFGTRWRLTDKPAVISVQGRFFMYPGTYGVSHGDDDPGFQNQPTIGYGQNAFELRGMIGKTFTTQITRNYKLPWYVAAEAGYRWSNKHVCNDIPYFIEGGFWPCSWFLVKSELDGYKVHGGTGSIKSEYGIWRIGGVWQIFGGDSVLREGDKMFNIEFQYGFVLWGKNTNAAQEWVLKVQTQF